MAGAAFDFTDPGSLVLDEDGNVIAVRDLSSNGFDLEPSATTSGELRGGVVPTGLAYWERLLAEHPGEPFEPDPAIRHPTTAELQSLADAERGSMRPASEALGLPPLSLSNVSSVVKPPDEDR